MTRRPLKALAGALFLLALSGVQADARQTNDDSYFRQHSVGAVSYPSIRQDRVYPGPGKYQKRKTFKASKAKRVSRAVHRNARPHVARAAVSGAQILPHPAGCPSRAFCGCGVALKLLGKPVRAGGLAIAQNWMGFPRTGCAPGMAAARRGHVFAIEQCLPGNRALAYDPNSGRGLTRLHVRSLAGYAVVNPHGSYTQINGQPGRAYRTRYAKRYKHRRYAHAG